MNSLLIKNANVVLPDEVKLTSVLIVDGKISQIGYDGKAEKEIDANGDYRTVHTTRGDIFGHGILIATGAAPRRGGFAGEEEYRGRGIGYCATCDGSFFAGKDVYVVGGGFAAA